MIEGESGQRFTFIISSFPTSHWSREIRKHMEHIEKLISYCGNRLSLVSQIINLYFSKLISAQLQLSKKHFFSEKVSQKTKQKTFYKILS